MGSMYILFFFSLRRFWFSTTRLRKLFLDGIGSWWVKFVISNVFKGESIRRGVSS